MRHRWSMQLLWMFAWSYFGETLSLPEIRPGKHPRLSPQFLGAKSPQNIIQGKQLLASHSQVVQCTKTNVSSID